MSINTQNIKIRDIEIVAQKQIQYNEAVKGSYNIYEPIPPETANGITVFDPITQSLFYNKNGSWKLIQDGITGTGATKMDSISMIKVNQQSISPLTNTIITGFTGTPAPYIMPSGWDPVTGIYTAPSLGFGNHTLDIDINIAWKGGVSNLGNRTLNLIFKKFGGSPIIIKGVSTQADANAAVETTQELSTVLADISANDQVWLEVYHNAPIPLILSGNYATSICGFRVYLTI